MIHKTNVFLGNLWLFLKKLIQRKRISVSIKLSLLTCGSFYI